MSHKFCCMVMRMSIDCNGCYKKISRTLHKMHELKDHWIERKESRVSVCGEFVPQDLVIRMRKAINRRVEILEIKESDLNLEAAGDHDGGARGINAVLPEDTTNSKGEEITRRKSKKRVQFATTT